MTVVTDPEPAASAAAGAGTARGMRRRRLALLLPGVAFVAVAGLLAFGLGRDPRLVPSPLVGKPVPRFSLPPVAGRALGLSSAHLRGEVSIVNVFASWCAACREEHPLLLALANEGSIPVHGLNYKDRAEDADAWLDALGDPYTRTGADLDGRVGIDWGVYGVPETFLVDAGGRIVFKQIGPLTPAVLEERILPLARALAGSPRAAPETRKRRESSRGRFNDTEETR